jgi:hypothetical protein
MDPGVLALFIPILGISIGGIAVLTSHKQKMAEIKAKTGTRVDTAVLAAVNELRNDLTELRDTTTKYDLSFDAALQRMESRVGNLENRVISLEQAPISQAVTKS